jgi:ParB family chromosome partitioning protein
MTESKKTALGRGLASLLDPSDKKKQDGDITKLSIGSIKSGAFQPRTHFSQDDLLELAISIRAVGVLQPILVRRSLGDGTTYEIIAGERRWRAAKLAALEEIPVIIRDFSDKQTLEVALLENIQRQDLNPVEEAEGYRRLMEDFGHTQESLSRILGKSRSHIANAQRLLALPTKVLEALREGKLSAGHGRALLSAENPEKMAEMILEKGLNVRETEALAKEKGEISAGGRHSSYTDPEKEILQEQLSTLFGRPISLTLKSGGGKIIIPFKNPTELDSLINSLNELKPRETKENDGQKPSFHAWSA